MSSLKNNAGLRCPPISQQFDLINPVKLQLFGCNKKSYTWIELLMPTDSTTSSGTRPTCVWETETKPEAVASGKWKLPECTYECVYNVPLCQRSTRHTYRMYNTNQSNHIAINGGNYLNFDNLAKVVFWLISTTPGMTSMRVFPNPTPYSSEGSGTANTATNLVIFGFCAIHRYESHNYLGVWYVSAPADFLVFST